MQEGWTSFTQYVFLTNKLSARFQALPFSVAAALGVARLSHAVTIVIVIESLQPDIFITDLMISKAFPTSIHAPYKAVAVLVRMLGHSKTKARPPKQCRITTATATETALVTIKDVLDITNATESSHLSLETVATRETLLKIMNGALRLYQRFLKFLQDAEAPVWRGSWQEQWPVTMKPSVLHPPPAKPSKQRRRCVKRKEHERVLRLCGMSLKGEVHGHIFYSGVQFTSWWWHFCACIVNDEENTEKIKKFEVKLMQVFYRGELYGYQPNQWLNRLLHRNEVEQTAHFRRKGLPFNSIFAHVC